MVEGLLQFLEWLGGTHIYTQALDFIQYGFMERDRYGLA
jgi:hypothetical protein